MRVRFLRSTLPIGPGVIGLGEAMLDAVFEADAIEHVDAIAGCRSQAVLNGIAELNAVVGEHGVDLVGNGFDKSFEEAGCGLDVGGLMQLGESELGCSVDGHEQM